MRHARIKRGATVFQDFGVFEWPGCKPPSHEFDEGEEYRYETKYPDAVFEVDCLEVLGKPIEKKRI